MRIRTLARAQSLGLFFFLSNFCLAANEIVCPPIDQSEVSGEALKAWRESLIQDVIKRRFNQVTQALKICFPGKLPSCLTDLAEYNQREKDGRGPPETPTCNNRILSSVTDLPPEFVHQQDGSKFIKFPQNHEQLAKAKGWKTALYKTRGSGGFDNSQLLYLAVIPGTKENGMKDHYLQISPRVEENNNVDDPKGKAANDNPHIGLNVLTVISVDRSQHPPVGQLKRLHKNPGGNYYTWSQHIEVQECQQCHTVPLRAISPVGYGQLNAPEIAMSKEEQENIRAINEMMNIPELSWGQCETSDNTLPLGPSVDSHPLGWAPKGSHTRKKEFIETCIRTTPKTKNFFSAAGYKKQFTLSENFETKVDRDKIAKAMNCVECHDNGKRGYMHVPFSASEITFKVLVDRSMPLGFDSMSVDERMVLLNCLNREKDTLIRSEAWEKSGEWMRRRFCEDFQVPEANAGKTRDGVK